MTHYYYGGGQVIETREAASASADPASLTPQYQYVRSASRDVPILRDTYTTVEGVTAIDPLQRIYYLTDADNNVTAITDASGAVVERYVYDPYGGVTKYNYDWSDASTYVYSNTILFAGQELDPPTGLYYTSTVGRLGHHGLARGLDQFGFVDRLWQSFGHRTTRNPAADGQQCPIFERLERQGPPLAQFPPPWLRATKKTEAIEDRGTRVRRCRLWHSTCSFRKNLPRPTPLPERAME